jgi:hypothetical protein
MQANLVPMTQSIASAVALIAAAAENMKDADGWVNPEDPTVIAENELMGAAATIDHAAKRLRELRPRRDVNYKVGLLHCADSFIFKILCFLFVNFLN